MSVNFDIKLKRPNKIYHEGVSISLIVDDLETERLFDFPFQDDLTGAIIFDCRSETKHEGISLTVEGSVNMQLSSKNVGIFDAFYNSIRVSSRRA